MKYYAEVIWTLQNCSQINGWKPKIDKFRLEKKKKKVYI